MPDNHQLPFNAYYTENGSISIRKPPKDYQIESLKERIINLENLVHTLIRERNELKPTEPNRETQDP